MQNEINDFFVDIIQDFNEIESLLKVLKDSVNSENNEIVFADIANTLEIVLSKIYNTKISLNKVTEITVK